MPRTTTLIGAAVAAVLVAVGVWSLQGPDVEVVTTTAKPSEAGRQVGKTRTQRQPARPTQPSQAAAVSAPPEVPSDKQLEQMHERLDRSIVGVRGGVQMWMSQTGKDHDEEIQALLESFEAQTQDLRESFEDRPADLARMDMQFARHVAGLRKKIEAVAGAAPPEVEHILKRPGAELVVDQPPLNWGEPLDWK